MPTILVFSILIFLWADFNLLNFSASLSPLLHQACLTSISGSHISLPLKQAFLCGHESIPANLVQDFRDTGLVHWLVVSGSHLTFLCALLERIPLPGYLRSVWALPLYLFAAATGFNPPVFRAFISFLILSSLKRRHFPTDISVLAVGIVCLCIQPQLYRSLSFYLSWATALCLALPFKNKILPPTVIYFSILPLLLPLGAPGPLSIFFNVILSSFFGTILFPITLAEVFFPFLTKFTTLVWEWMALLIHELALWNTSLYPTAFNHSLLYALFLLTLHIFARIGFVYLRRRFLCRP